MASKKDKSGGKPGPTLPQVARATVDQVKLARRFFSGALEAERQTRRIFGSPPWRIVRYERILDPEEAVLPIPRNLFVRPKTLRKHLKMLKRHFTLCSLDELTEQLVAGESIADGSVAITIDGGWTDTFVNAFPILQEEEVPVTIFLPTAFIGTQEMFWRDRVALALLTMKNAGITIEPFEFFAEPIKEAFQTVCPDGIVNAPAIFLMVEGLRRAQANHRALALGVLRETFNALGGKFPNESFFVNWAEVETMERLGARFGSLTHSHTPFRDLEMEAIYDDIAHSLTILGEHLKNPIRVVAAPLGDFDGKCVDPLASHGIRACLVEEGVDDSLALAEPVRVLRRVCPCEGDSYTTELFFCKLWDLNPQEDDD